MKYDQIILGSGHDAFEAAMQAAEQGMHVALVKAGDESLPQLTAADLMLAADRVVSSGEVTISALRTEAIRIADEYQAEWHRQLSHLGVDVCAGSVRFLNDHQLEVGNEATILSATTVVMATGCRSVNKRHLPLHGKTVITSESLLDLPSLPKSLCVVGAGKTGLDYAILLARLGVEVTVIDAQSSPPELCLNFLEDDRTSEAQSLGVAFRLGDEVVGVRTVNDQRVAVPLASGIRMTFDCVLLCVGREGRTDGMNLEAVGVGLDEHGRVWCDAAGRSWIPSILAVGEVVGFRSHSTMAS